MTRDIVTGSIAAVAARGNRSIAESMLDVEHVIMIDCSGSMEMHDSQGGRSRHAVACEHLARLQAEFPGKIAVVAFSSHAQFMPGGVPPQPIGGTDVTGALTFSKKMDGPGVQFVLISDGQPDDEASALAVAKTYKAKISTIYVGPETERGGADFLRRLAVANGGQFQTADRVTLLADVMRPLLTAGAHP